MQIWLFFLNFQLLGYPAEDLLLRPSLNQLAKQVFEQLREIKDIVLVFGAFVNETEDGQAL